MLTCVEFLPEGVRMEFVDNQELTYAVNDSYYEVLAKIFQEHGIRIPDHDLSAHQNQNVYLMGVNIQERLADYTGFSHIEIEQENHDMEFMGNVIRRAIPGHVYVRFTVCDLTAFILWTLQNNFTGLISDDHQLSSQIRDHFQKLSRAQCQ